MRQLSKYLGVDHYGVEVAAGIQHRHRAPAPHIDVCRETHHVGSRASCELRLLIACIGVVISA
ncbi:hypothetical protein ABIF38_001304 [Bradyrhizobium japonicum]|nr:hypothetical protein [Bradyrhizobium elkanii]